MAAVLFIAHLDIFLFILQFTIVFVSKLQKVDPSAIAKCAMVFVPPLAVEKEETEAFFLTPLHNLQMCKAFIPAFTSEKR
jgi:hypothetical protein